jgi:hypothetical protein
MERMKNNQRIYPVGSICVPFILVISWHHWASNMLANTPGLPFRRRAMQIAKRYFSGCGASPETSEAIHVSPNFILSNLSLFR